MKQPRESYVVLADLESNGKKYVAQIEIDAVHPTHARGEAICLARRQLAEHGMDMPFIQIRDVLLQDSDYQLTDTQGNDVPFTEYDLWITDEILMELGTGTGKSMVVPKEEKKEEKETKSKTKSTTTKSYKTHDDPFKQEDLFLSAIATHIEYDLDNNRKLKGEG